MMMMVMTMEKNIFLILNTFSKAIDKLQDR